MASNSFGNYFRVTTWGESHGPAIGCVIDGCPAGLEIDIQAIDNALARRAPGQNRHVSERKEADRVELLSGVFEGKTTGAPICLLIRNQDADPSKYETMKDIYRPGHANYSYLKKYGLFDFRGGGRASARETAARVAAGAIAEILLSMAGISLFSYLKAVGDIEIEKITEHQSPIFCPDPEQEKKMCALLERVKSEKDSIGGVVECVARGVPPGLGDPIYEKLEAKLAAAIMSIPATKAFEIGEGVAASSMRGSIHNDQMMQRGFATNHAGGVLGGISTGEDIIFRAHFKPTSSIAREQKTLDVHEAEVTFSLPEGSRHDPCVAIRAVPVVKAMGALVLADCLLASRLSKLRYTPF